MIPGATASPSEATPSVNLSAEVRAVLASPQALFLPLRVRSLVQVLADTVNALEGRVLALESQEKNHV